MEFNKKGDYLATGGQDTILRIWTICGSTSDTKRWDTKLYQQLLKKKKSQSTIDTEI